MANRKKSSAKKKSCLVGFVVTPTVFDAYHARAEELGLTLSEFCRRTLDRELVVTGDPLKGIDPQLVADAIADAIIRQHKS